MYLKTKVLLTAITTAVTCMPTWSQSFKIDPPKNGYELHAQLTTRSDPVVLATLKGFVYGVMAKNAMNDRMFAFHIGLNKSPLIKDELINIASIWQSNYCIPSGMPIDDLLEPIQKYMEKSRQSWHSNAESAVEAALADKFNCK